MGGEAAQPPTWNHQPKIFNMNFSNFKKSLNASTYTYIYGVLLFFVLVQPDYVAAQRTVKGVVTDNQNSPLIGASIVAVGYAKGAVANVEGKFTLEIPTQCQEIEVSYVGFNPQKIALDTRTFYSIALQSSKKGKNSAGTQNSNSGSKVEKEDTPLRKISRLFGITTQIGYRYQDGMNKMPLGFYRPDGTTLNGFDYKFNELNARLSIITPIIELSRTYTINTFSNEFANKIKYDLVELNFDGLPLLLTKKDASNAGGYGTGFWSTIVPNFYWKKVIGDNYYNKSFSYNFLFGMMGNTKEEFEIEDSPTLSTNGTVIQGGFRYSYNRFDFFSMSGLFDRVQRLYFNTNRLAKKLKLDTGNTDYSSLKIFYYVPFPCLDLFNQKGEVKYFDQNKDIIYSLVTDKSTGLRFSLVYQPYFRFKKNNIWLIPNVTWVILDGSNNTIKDGIGNPYIGQEVEFDQKYFSAKINLQIVF